MSEKQEVRSNHQVCDVTGCVSAGGVRLKYRTARLTLNSTISSQCDIKRLWRHVHSQMLRPVCIVSRSPARVDLQHAGAPSFIQEVTGSKQDVTLHWSLDLHRSQHFLVWKVRGYVTCSSHLKVTPPAFWSGSWSDDQSRRWDWETTMTLTFRSDPMIQKHLLLASGDHKNTNAAEGVTALQDQSDWQTHGPISWRLEVMISSFSVTTFSLR